jgi:hypothetical protein
LQGSADLRQVRDHLEAFGGVSQQVAQGSGKVSAGKVLLNQLGHDAASSDEVDHGDGEITVGVRLGRDLGRVADEAFGELVGQGRDLVDDNEGASNDGGLHGGSAAGHDAGSGVMEGFAGVGNEVEIG